MFSRLERAADAAPLFEGWQDTMIWSCLEGVMGDIYADEALESAAAVIGDFAFCAGEPAGDALELLTGRGFVIAAASSARWEELIENCCSGAKRVTRFAFRKDGDVFDREKLLRAPVPDGYCLRMIDRGLFDACRAAGWCRDFVSLFESYEQYDRYGLGVVAVKDGEIAAGASSYSTYSGGIEIEIDTKPEHRRQGLAYACGARLILECLERGLYPSWDAQNRISAALAVKLGYNFSHEYTAYEIGG